MRALLNLLLVSFALLSPLITLSYTQEELPDWVKEIRSVPYSAYNVSEMEYTGEGFLIKDIYWEITDTRLNTTYYNDSGVTEYTLSVDVQIKPVKGFVFSTTYLPALNLSFSVQDEGVVGYNITPLCISHIDEKYNDVIFLNIMFYARPINPATGEVATFFRLNGVDLDYGVYGYNVTFYVIWSHYRFYKENMTMSLVKQEQLSASVSYNERGYTGSWDFSIRLVPKFYYIDDNNTRYLIYGYYFKFLSTIYGKPLQSKVFGGAITVDLGNEYVRMEGYGFMAWDTYKIAENTSLTDFQEKIKRINGWYVWVGTGIKYYLPYKSVYESHHIENFVSWFLENNLTVNEFYDRLKITSNTMEFNYTDLNFSYSYPPIHYYIWERDEHYRSMRINILFKKIDVKEYVYDTKILYEKFVKGELDKYLGATIYQEYYRKESAPASFIVSIITLVPIFLSYMITAKIGKPSLAWGFLIGVIIGFFMGLYTITALLIAVLTFTAYLVGGRLLE